MPKIDCELCKKEINVEDKDYVCENKGFYHKECYFSQLKQEKEAIYLAKLKKFLIYFTISIIIFITLYVFQEPSNLFINLILYILMVLMISFGIIVFILMIQTIRLK